MDKLSDYLMVREAAELLGVTPNTMRNWEREKKIVSYRNPINKYRLYRKEDIDKFMLVIKGEPPVTDAELQNKKDNEIALANLYKRQQIEADECAKKELASRMRRIEELQALLTEANKEIERYKHIDKELESYKLKERESQAADLCDQILKILSSDGSFLEKEDLCRNILGINASAGTQLASKELDNRPIDILELSVRAHNCLLAAKFNTIGDIQCMGKEGLLRIKNFGKKSYEEVLIACRRNKIKIS